MRRCVARRDVSSHRSGTTIILTRRYLQLCVCVFVNCPSPVDHQKLTPGPERAGAGEETGL